MSHNARSPIVLRVSPTAGSGCVIDGSVLATRELPSTGTYTGGIPLGPQWRALWALT